jgi:hypothetical protein
VEKSRPDKQKGKLDESSFFSTAVFVSKKSCKKKKLYKPNYFTLLLFFHFISIQQIIEITQSRENQKNKEIDLSFKKLIAILERMVWTVIRANGSLIAHI